METLLEQIKAAVGPDATQEARAAGVHACRTILAALATPPGEPLVQTPVPAAPQIPASAIRAAVTVLRGMPVDQLLDLAIARVRAAVPVGTELGAVQPLKFNLVQLPTQR